MRFARFFVILQKKNIDEIVPQHSKTLPEVGWWQGHIDDELYELRVMWENNIYRVFFIFDEGNVVVLFSGFQKKTQKTPQSEIDKAIRIKEAYYADKRPSNQGL